MSLWNWLKRKLEFNILVLSMVPIKQAVIQMIQKMPEKASVADIMAELYFRTKVDKGLMHADRKETVSHEHVKKNFKKWLKLK